MSTGFHRRPEFEIVGAVDLEKGKPGRGKSAGSSTGCNPTYARNIGVVPKNADLTRLDAGEYRGELGLAPGELNVLISCAPCTGFSQKNARNHIEDDPRNALVVRTAEFVGEFLPEFLVMENVKELLTGKHRHHFTALRQQLEALDYHVWARVHDLATYGLPQRRLRTILIARRGAPVVPLPEGAEPVRTVRDTIGHLPPVKAGEQHPSDPMHIAPGNTARVLRRIKAIPADGGSWGDIMNSHMITECDKYDLLTPAMFRARPGSFPDVYGRLAWDRPAVTITRECSHVGNGRYTHPEQDRLLTVREMALLQGFPEDYNFEGKITAKYNQIGDAVPPLIAGRIAAHIAEMMRDAAAPVFDLAAECYAGAGCAEPAFL